MFKRLVLFHIIDTEEMSEWSFIFPFYGIDNPSIDAVVTSFKIRLFDNGYVVTDCIEIDQTWEM